MRKKICGITGSFYSSFNKFLAHVLFTLKYDFLEISRFYIQTIRALAERLTWGDPRPDPCLKVMERRAQTIRLPPCERFVFVTQIDRFNKNVNCCSLLLKSIVQNQPSRKIDGFQS